jgi:hypothetical protein
MVGGTPFPSASCYPTTAGRNRAGVRSVDGWGNWISPTRKDQAGQRGEAQEAHSGLVDAERLDLRPSVTSTAASAGTCDTAISAAPSLAFSPFDARCFDLAD